MIVFEPLAVSLLCAIWAMNIWRGNSRRRREGAGLGRVGRFLRRGREAAEWNGPRWSRLSGVLMGIAMAALVAGLVPLQDLLAAWTTSDNGLLILAAADLALAGAVYWEWWHRHGYEQFWTNAACGLGGLCAVVTYAELPQMIAQAVKLAPGTAAAVTKMSHRINTGKAAKAAHALPGASHSQYLTFAGIAVFVVILFIGLGGFRAARRAHARLGRAANSRNSRGGGPGGRGGSIAAPGGRGMIG